MYIIQLEGVKCGCPDHKGCCYQPGRVLSDGIDDKSLAQLFRDIYANVVLLGDILSFIGLEEYN